MEGLGVLLVVVATFVANLPALREQWHSDRAGFVCSSRWGVALDVGDASAAGGLIAAVGE